MADNDFLRARMQIAAKIEKLETDLKYWQSELQAFDRVETTMRRLVGGNGTPPADLKLEVQEQPRATGPTDNESQVLREALANPPKRRGDLRNRVLAVVLEHKGKKVTSTEVERAILQSGYKPKGRNFDVAVFQTLKRLSKKEIVRRKYDGKVTFHARIEGEKQRPAGKLSTASAGQSETLAHVV